MDSHLKTFDVEYASGPPQNFAQPAKNLAAPSEDGAKECCKTSCEPAGRLPLSLARSSQENVSSSNNSKYIRILRCYVASSPGFVIIITLSQVAIMAQI